MANNKKEQKQIEKRIKKISDSMSQLIKKELGDIHNDDNFINFVYELLLFKFNKFKELEDDKERNKIIKEIKKEIINKSGLQKGKGLEEFKKSIDKDIKVGYNKSYQLHTQEEFNGMQKNVGTQQALQLVAKSINSNKLKKENAEKINFFLGQMNNGYKKIGESYKELDMVKYINGISDVLLYTYKGLYYEPDLNDQRLSGLFTEMLSDVFKFVPYKIMLNVFEYKLKNNDLIKQVDASLIQNSYT